MEKLYFRILHLITPWPPHYLPKVQSIHCIVWTVQCKIIDSLPINNFVFDWLLGLKILFMIDWLLDYLIGWWIDYLIELLINLLVGWLVDELIDWLNYWLIYWLVDWLMDWLIEIWMIIFRKNIVWVDFLVPGIFIFKQIQNRLADLYKVSRYRTD